MRFADNNKNIEQYEAYPLKPVCIEILTLVPPVVDQKKTLGQINVSNRPNLGTVVEESNYVQLLN